ncbi:uncharacterized protein LOC129779611 [Toxorhynchites rutilus septentrionalis]|uniref:uncharacterized protein LOC129779611 n=1 Tax=Toxorhynchites rutilus septentrionalis TaxID=329112 RepID=UPI00247A564A|nr:uncharacterized protein LOC129779611 [Toxorhynchites rutilus septentrionalis]
MDEQPYNNFNPTRCNICFTRNVHNRLTVTGQKLRFCKGCRMIGYCGEQHQKEDWKYHKDFCRSVMRILTTKRVEHILDIRDDSGNIVGSTKRNLECAISLAESMIISMLRRKLHRHEHTLLRFPNICRVCYEYDSSKLKGCEACFQVLYCSEEHRLQDAENHAKWCEMYRVNLLLDADFPEYEDILNFPKLTAFELSTFPKNSFDLVNTAYKTRISSTPKTAEDFKDLKYVSNYSHVGSILYALYTTNMHLELQQSLVIYVVGAEDELLFFDYNICAIIFTYLPQVRDVIVHFIGPQLYNFKEDVELTFKGARTVKMRFHMGLYHTLDANEFLGRPQLVISYNCGFHEYVDSNRESWGTTLARLLRFVNIPIVFTSYTRDEACQDCAIVQRVNKRAAKKRDLVFVKRAAVNPFKDYKPLRNTSYIDERDELYHSNGYISLVITRVP